MSYASPLYLFVFLPVVLLLYQIVSQKHRWKILLIASYFFFYLISGKLLIFIIASTFSIHHIGLWLSACKKDYIEKKIVTSDKIALKAAYVKKRRGILLFGIGLQIGVLLFLKYFNFIGLNINGVLKQAASPVLIPFLKLALPVGISFYSLQAVSYIADVYWERIEADDNLGRLALFMSFFPNIMEGPICRYKQTAEALYQGKCLEYSNVTFGMQRIIWGLFKKLVIADRLNPLVETVFNKHGQYNGFIVIVAAVCYTFQLYMDFSGCIDITIGIGRMFGATIPENFRQPFFSRTASEFWRRWHITLGTWFKDYIFYPISLTKFVKKLGKSSREKFGKHIGQIIPSSIALFCVWSCNGLWHGAAWNYIFYGMYYFILISLGNASEPLVQKVTASLKINRDSVLYRAFQTVKMLLIIFTGELFFRANGLQSGISMFKSIFYGFKWSAVTYGSVLRLGLSIQDFAVVFFGSVAVLAVGIIHEKGISISDKIAGRNIIFRWSLYYAAIMLVIILGAYGDGYVQAKLIYAGF
jgi:D-alanyl-lipoteichoic acid acyltransferase DltB (MBOAT superfamily)